MASSGRTWQSRHARHQFLIRTRDRSSRPRTSASEYYMDSVPVWHATLHQPPVSTSCTASTSSTADRRLYTAHPSSSPTTRASYLCELHLVLARFASLFASTLTMTDRILGNIVLARFASLLASTLTMTDRIHSAASLAQMEDRVSAPSTRRQTGVSGIARALQQLRPLLGQLTCLYSYSPA